MSRSRKTIKKWLLTLWVGLAVAAAVVIGVLSGDGSFDLGGTSGTMSGAEAFDVSDASFDWRGASLSGDRIGNLTDDLDVAVTVRSGRADPAAEFELFFSRDPDFDASEDCLVLRRSVPLDAGLPALVQFRTAAYSAPCVDAGLWYVAVRAARDGSWIPVDGTVQILGGVGDLVLADYPKEAGYRDVLSLGVDVYRESTSFGIAGLWEHPAEVWLKRDDQLCVVEAEALRIPREPVRQMNGTWTPTRVAFEVDGRAAKQVRGVKSLSEAASQANARLSSGEACEWTEGEWQVAVGPVFGQQMKVGKIFVHAAPMTIDPEPIKVTLVEGDVTSVERSARNPSRSAIQWVSAASDFMADNWLIGMSDQRLKSGKNRTVHFTISAADLQPGFYTGAFRITASDYYGTEISIPVELTVEAARLVVREEEELPPTQFELGNYPNPFNGRTTIRVQLETPGRVRLAVYDVSGRQVQSVVDEWLDAGDHEFPFEARDMPSGTYLYRVVTETGALSRTMTLVK